MALQSNIKKRHIKKRHKEKMSRSHRCHLSVWGYRGSRCQRPIPTSIRSRVCRRYRDGSRSRGFDGWLKARGSDSVALVSGGAGSLYEGALVNSNLVLFLINLYSGFSNLTYLVSTNTKGHYISGLIPNAPYTVAVQTISSHFQITIAPGGKRDSSHRSAGRRATISIVAVFFTMLLAASTPRQLVHG